MKKNKASKKKIYMSIMFAFGIVFATLLALLLKYSLSPVPEISDLKITNISNNSATISWITDDPSTGAVWYSTEDSFSEFFGMMTPDEVVHAYDDRDLEQNEEGEFVLKDEGKQERTTHHITLRNLLPETKYYFQVGNDFKMIEFENDFNEIVKTIETGPVIEDLRTPDPAYGEVRIKGEEGSIDGIIYLRLINNVDEAEVEEDLVLSSEISVPVSANNTYSLDMNNMRDENLEDLLAFEQLDSKIQVQLRTRDYGDQSYLFNSDKYKPLGTLEVNPELFDKISRNDLIPLFDVLSKDVLANEPIPCDIWGATDLCLLPGQPCCRGGDLECASNLCNGEDGYVGTCSDGDPDEERCVARDDLPTTHEEREGDEILAVLPTVDQLEEAGITDQTPYEVTVTGREYGEGNIILVTVDGVAEAIPVDLGDIANIPGREFDYDASRGCSPSGDWVRFDQLDVFDCTSLGGCEGGKCVDHSTSDLETMCGDGTGYYCGSAEESNILKYCYGDSFITIRDCSSVTGGECIPGDPGQHARCNQEVSEYCEESCTQTVPGSICDLGETPVNYDPESNQCSFEFPGEIIRVVDMTSSCNLNITNIPEFCEDTGDTVDCSATCEQINTDCHSTNGTVDYDLSTNVCNLSFPDDVSIDITLSSTCAIAAFNTLNDYQLKCSAPPDPKGRVSMSKAMINTKANSDDFSFESNSNSITLGNSGKYVLLDEDNQSISKFEIVIPEGEEAVIRLFADKNGNGIKDEGEESFKDHDRIKIEKEASAIAYGFNAGWNLISIPFVSNEEIATASDLLEILNSRGVEALHVAKYEDGQFKMYAKADLNGEEQQYNDDFNLLPGRGYFIKVNESAVSTLSGNRFAEPVKLTPSNGWNLVGFHGVDGLYDASEALNRFNDQGFSSDIISTYEWGLYSSLVEEDDVTYGNDFQLVEKFGYFVKVNDGAGDEKRFTP